MRPGQQQNKRMRGRGRKGPNPLSRSYESNGPDVKIRGNAQHIAEKYTTLARDASAAGDRVVAENYLQHAEHYGRIVAAAQGTFQLQREEGDGDGDYEDGDEEGMQENGTPNGHPYPVPERVQADRSQQPNQMQGNRDGRDNQNRDNQGNRDGQNQREYQGQRDNQNQNRDPQGNREQRFNRDDRPREFARDRNQARDNRLQGDNRSQGDDRRQWEGRGERQNWRERPVPNGLGPQPSIGDTPSVQDQQPAMRPHERDQPRAENHAERRDEVPAANMPVADQRAGFEPALPVETGRAAPAVSAEGERPNGEVRRRGRPRRPRFGENETVRAEEGAGVEPGPQASAPAAPPASVVEAAPVEGAVEAPVKRRPGRPRKKKPEDEAGEVSGELPAFLLASNG